MGTDPPGPAADSAKFEFATLKLLNGDQSARADIPFDVEALVEASPERDGTPDAGACTVQFFCRNTSTSEATRLGRVFADRVRDTNRYRAVLRCDGLQPGTYRIESAASMPSARDRFAYQRGPIFEVA